jgi:hypothetical protein
MISSNNDYYNLHAFARKKIYIPVNVCIEADDLKIVFTERKIC